MVSLGYTGPDFAALRQTTPDSGQNLRSAILSLIRRPGGRPKKYCAWITAATVGVVTLKGKKRHLAAAVRNTYAGLITVAAILSAIRKALLLLFGEGK